MNDNTPNIFIEGKSYKTEDYVEVVEKYKNKKILLHKNETFSFCITGFLILNRKLIVVFPKNFGLNYNDIKSDIILLLNALQRYKTEKIHPTDEQYYLYGDNKNYNGKLSTSMILLNDFKRNGYYKKTIVKKTFGNNGNIDWTKTINKATPIFSNKSIIYDNPIINNIYINNEYIITKIHEAIIYECIFVWGWVLNINFNNKPIELPCSIDEALYILSLEISKTYTSREISVLRNMIMYLRNHSGEQNSDTVEMLATPYFYYVWEYACGFIFRNEYQYLSSLIPQPRWSIPNVEKKISQRPDIIFLHENKLFILDAKYYNYRKNLPGWHDIVKQFFYQYSIENFSNINIDKAHNFFIFPEQSDIIVNYLGFVELENVHGLGLIHAISINTKVALKAYSNREKTPIKEDLIMLSKQL